nr:nucleotide-binding domain containing protein [Mycobacterium sp. OAS707]
MAGALGVAHARRLGVRPVTERAARTGRSGSSSVVLAGSCSRRTLEQIDHMKRRGHPSFRLDALQSPDSAVLAEQALGWFDRQQFEMGPLIYSSLSPHELGHAQKTLGSEHASRILESAMGRIASGLVERGVNALVVAGGETSGAVVTALQVQGGVIGEEAAPGVPWILTTGARPMALLLKSGNFGDRELLSEAAMGQR